MKRIFLFSAIALLAVVSCSEKGGLQEGFNSSDQIAIAPVSVDGNVATRGYVETGEFAETYWLNLHDATKPVATPRTMQISAYLYPQNGAEGNYFVGTTFAKGDDNLWHADPKIYWPVGGKLDFLAFSLTTEEGCSKNVNVKWDSENAASKVTLTVPAENTQNDILYASAANVKAKKEAEAISMKFNHAQAWLEFQLTGTPAGVVRVKSIEIEDAYNAGVLTINNNSGNPLAQWDFAGQKAQNIPVDNKYNVCKLTESAQFMDMLIPEQSKTTFVIYYVLSADDDVDMNDPDNILSYRFTTDQKTWLAGEKYIYKININTNEVTVHPEVAAWRPTTVTESKVKVEYDEEIGSVTIESLDDMAAAAPIQTVEGTCKTWGGRVKLTATVNDGKAGEWRFEKWSDGSTENPHIVTVTEDVTYKAFFTKEGTVVSVTITDAAEGYGKVTINGREITSLKVIPGEKVTIKAIPTEGTISKFSSWFDGSTDAEREITVRENPVGNEYAAQFNIQFKVAAKDEKTGFVNVVDLDGNPLTPNEDGVYTAESSKVKLIPTTGVAFNFKEWEDEITSNPRVLTAADLAAFSPFTAEFELNDYVTIKAIYKGSTESELKWKTQNLAITDIGERSFSNTLFQYGDYFQWATYENYAPVADLGGGKTDKGLLVYKSSNGVEFKTDYTFTLGSSPYYSDNEYSKYTNNEKAETLKTTDDVANIILGSNWRMPTTDEFRGLLNATYWVCDASDKGFYVYEPKSDDDKGKSNISSNIYNKYEALLFFPLAGQGWYGTFLNSEYIGLYWTSTSYPALDESFGCMAKARCFRLNSTGNGNIEPNSNERRFAGCSVRPVSK